MDRGSISAVSVCIKALPEFVIVAALQLNFGSPKAQEENVDWKVRYSAGGIGMVRHSSQIISRDRKEKFQTDLKVNNPAVLKDNDCILDKYYMWESVASGGDKYERTQNRASLETPQNLVLRTNKNEKLRNTKDTTQHAVLSSELSEQIVDVTLSVSNWKKLVSIVRSCK